MGPRELIGILDELERRRRRDYFQARALLLRLSGGQAGSSAAVSLEVPQAERMAPPLLLDYADAADALRVSKATVKRLVAAGSLPTVKVNGATRIRRVDLDAYVARLGRGSSSPPRPMEER